MECPLPLLGDSAEPVETRPTAWVRSTLTVLFTDICGSTQLSRDMELEAYGDLFLQIESIWQEAARAHHGLVSRMQGDGAMLLFGHPLAGERDVVNAINSALFIHDRISRLKPVVASGVPRLRARSGVHTGVALIRAGNPAQGLYNVMGEAPNIAGTLEKHARPEEVLVSVGSLKPYEGLFVLERRSVPAVEEDLSADGSDQDAGAVVHVCGQNDASRRFDATAQRGLTPLIGRAAILSALTGFLAFPNECQRIAVVTAPAGLGKTRVLYELASSPKVAAYRVMRGSCESYRETEVLQPFVQMLRAGLTHTDGTGGALDRAAVESALRNRNVDELLGVFGQIAARSRLLLVIDDWQWADDASRRLLQALLDLPDGPRVLLAARPSPEGLAWMPGGLQLQIDPWSESQTTQAVQRWLTDADPMLIAKLHRYAGGTPLLVEELCHSNSAFRLWQQLEGRGMPRDTGLKLLVASRLARLADDLADTVRAASIIGNEVPRWLLEEVCAAPLSDTQLGALADSDFLYPAPGQDVLRFKHGITRSAVYEHVSLSLRQVMHQRARHALEARSTPTGPGDLAALAYHCAGAGEYADASRFAEQAGHEALKAFSMDVARGHYQRAMESLERVVPATAEQMLHWCDLACRFAMASVFDPLALGNDASVFEKAVQIAQEHGGPLKRAECLYWLGYVLYSFGRFREAVIRAREALMLSQQVGHTALASQVEATLGEILVGTGEYDEAVWRIDTAVAAKRQRAGSGSGARSLAVGSAYAMACKGSALADRGNFGSAQACFDEAIELLGKSTHPVGNSVRNWIAVAYLWQGRWEQARHVASESARIAENTGALYLVAVSRSTLGYAQWCESGDAQGLQLMTDAVHWMRARRGQMFTSLHFGWLAEACVAEGKGREARELTAHVLRRSRQGEQLGQAIACRSMALLAVRDGDMASVERWLQRAERSAAERRSPREAALNEIAKGRTLDLQPDGHPAQRAIDRGHAVLRAMGVSLPFKSPLLGR